MRKGLIRRLFSSAETVLAGKDLRAILGSGGIRALLTILPVILVVVLPVVTYVVISLLPETEPPPALLAALPENGAGPRQWWMSAFTSLICPVLYLCVPICCAVGSASRAFVGEKEDRTLETLFLSAMSGRSIFHVKVTACVLLSVLISWISFLVFSITVSILDLLLGAPYFFNLEWLVAAALLTPALALFSVVFVSLLLPRAQGVGEALQTMGYLTLPLLALYLAQLAGALRVGPVTLVILSALLLAAAVALFNRSARRFQLERITAGPPQ